MERKQQQVNQPKVKKEPKRRRERKQKLRLHQRLLNQRSQLSQISKTSSSFTNQCTLIAYGRLPLKQEKFKSKYRNQSLR
jgi:hypothetical protein